MKMAKASRSAGKRSLRIGLAFLASGIIVYGGLLAWLLPRRDILVDMPVSLAPGHLITPPFTPNVEGHYELEIEVRRTLPDAITNCLLGLSGADMTSAYPDGCGSNRSVLKASWKLLSDGRRVASGQSRADQGGGWAKDTIDKELGSFPLSPGRTYVLSVDVSSDGSRLDAAKPRLRLELSAMEYEGEVVVAQLVGPIGLMLLLIGIVMTGSAVVRYLIARRP